MKTKTVKTIQTVTITALIIVALWFLSGCAHSVIGNCVPRALFAACAWTIENRAPVYIADTKGHWQAMGMHKSRLVYLDENGRAVWPDKSHNGRDPVKVLDLREAIEAFLVANPWAMGGE